MLTPPAVRVRQPTRVRLTVDGRAEAPVRVGPLGLVTLPRAVRGRHFRLDVLDARFPAGTSGHDRQRRAVGIGEIEGAGVSARSAHRAAGRSRSRAASRRSGSAVAWSGSAGPSTVRRWRRAAAPARVRTGAVEAETRRDPGRFGRQRRRNAPGFSAKRSARPLAALPARRMAIAGDRPLRVDALRLASVIAPAATPAVTGRVLDSGTPSGNARRGARIAVDAPSWLVFGESYDQHWRATCDGRDLGTPRPMQGYANAWPVTAGCRSVDFTYNLQRAATAGYLISLVGCVLLLLVALVGFRRRRSGRSTPRAHDDAEPPPLRVPPADGRGHLALVPALAAVAAIGLAFGLRAGAVAAVAFAAIAWRGISDRALGFIAAALLGVGVPLAYIVAAIIHDDEGRGGNSHRLRRQPPGGPLDGPRGAGRPRAAAGAHAARPALRTGSGAPMMINMQS